MSPAHIAALAFLGFGMLCESICFVGLLYFDNAFDQLHYTSAATTVGLVAIALAVVMTGFSSVSGTIECVTSLAMLFTLNPVLTFATARAGREARFGNLSPTEKEFRRQP